MCNNAFQFKFKPCVYHHSEWNYEMSHVVSSFWREKEKKNNISFLPLFIAHRLSFVSRYLIWCLSIHPFIHPSFHSFCLFLYYISTLYIYIHKSIFFFFLFFLHLIAESCFSVFSMFVVLSHLHISHFLRLSTENMKTIVLFASLRTYAST